MKSSFTIFAFNQVQISTYKFNQSMINTYKARSQALGYTLWFSLFSLKLNIFRFSASILTFSTQNHLILTYFTHLDTTHFFYNTIMSTENAIRKSKWIISSNKASNEAKRPSHIYTWIHRRERKIVFFIVTYDVCLKWEFPRSCLRRSVYSSVHCPYWILTACIWKQYPPMCPDVGGAYICMFYL